MNLGQQAQLIKTQYDRDLERQHVSKRRKEKYYHEELAKQIARAILQKRVKNGNIIYVKMRMDSQLSFSSTEINLLLRDQYVRVKCIDTIDTDLNECSTHPACVCCCPCIGLPKIAFNCIFGTVYIARVYLDV